MIKACEECGAEFVAKGRLRFCELHRGAAASYHRRLKMLKESTAITRAGQGRKEYKR